ncbi:uncharacterized protein LOC106778685 isoform X2 [Vigna radiata var. radiata]|uniref:Uncharacterized protein LOC106778685 isoform X2 n=1 Tax=Vigna radiata var. radiata TaxID=3916 RepID=A0A3Q0EP45_VIGRR|nr:uncharacterized protein LOC106778685 isoform X2 [Vigna radiata var. radiata]
MGVAEANTALQAPSKATSESVEALLDAARYNDMDDVKSLEASGVPLDSKDDQGRTDLNGTRETMARVEQWSSRSHNVSSPTPITHGGDPLNVPLYSSKTHVAAANHERTPMDEAVSRGKLEVMDAINEAVALVELRGAMVSAQET